MEEAIEKQPEVDDIERPWFYGKAAKRFAAGGNVVPGGLEELFASISDDTTRQGIEERVEALKNAVLMAGIGPTRGTAIALLILAVHAANDGKRLFDERGAEGEEALESELAFIRELRQLVGGRRNGHVVDPVVGDLEEDGDPRELRRSA
jgi:hypothetical protein